MHWASDYPLVLLAILLGSFAASAEPAAKPPAGPAVKIGQDDQDQRRAADREAEERRQRQPLIDAQNSRDHADRLRAGYEHDHKPGPVPKEARDTFDEVLAAYAQAIDRSTASPEIADVVLYCHLRLAGAYQYTQQFDKAIEQAQKAAKSFAGTPREIEAVYNEGLIYLQALHDPKSAMTSLKRAHELAQSMQNEQPETRAKWLTATAEAMERCEKELAKN
jgi:tetratricopeptide (TPR) repeat protein